MHAFTFPMLTFLAKESTKAYGTGERNFGCSRG
ncbi:inovirus Gp2 family protein [Escherichia coli]|nr:inovirus Gp2 family protein [Escherichia coli]